jgi:hypothetical protein
LLWEASSFSSATLGLGVHFGLPMQACEPRISANRVLWVFPLFFLGFGVFPLLSPGLRLGFPPFPQKRQNAGSSTPLRSAQNDGARDIFWGANRRRMGFGGFPGLEIESRGARHPQRFHLIPDP